MLTFAHSDDSLHNDRPKKRITIPQLWSHSWMVDTLDGDVNAFVFTRQTPGFGSRGNSSARSSHGRIGGRGRSSSDNSGGGGGGGGTGDSASAPMLRPRIRPSRLVPEAEDAYEAGGYSPSPRGSRESATSSGRQKAAVRDNPPLIHFVFALTREH